MLTVDNFKIHFQEKEFNIMSERVNGTVKWFSRAKGFGFIAQASGPDVFVHFSAIRGEGHRNLRPGQTVEFGVETGPKGPQALDVCQAQAG